jgi:pyrimidine-nucleoside phosphorylase
MAAMAMAIYFTGMVPDELAAWTRAMLHSGETLDFGDIRGAKVDKHSTGGVGDKTSFVLGPIAASAGLRVPMISGRGLGHTGGTLDKLESIHGFEVALDLGRLKQIVATQGIAIVGQTAEVCPADRLLYALRDVTGTVGSIPLIASSIMSKKLAEGLDGLVLDVKVGSGAFMRTLAQARELATTMISIGRLMGVETRALLTDMNQPLGRAVGNALEIREAVEALRGGGPEDLVEISVALAAQMLVVGRLAHDTEQAVAICREELCSGRALQVFRDMVEAQGGDPRVLDDLSRLPQATLTEDLLADRDGTVTEMDCLGIGIAAMHLGAGRAVADDAVDHAVGLVLHKKLGDRVKSGDRVATLHANHPHRVDAVKNELRAAIVIGPERPDSRPLIIEMI